MYPFSRGVRALRPGWVARLGCAGMCWFASLAVGCIGQVVDDGPPLVAVVPDSEATVEWQQSHEIERCPGGRAHVAATGLRIRELAIYQTLKIPLYIDGGWRVKHVVPLVQGKRALVRIFVEPGEGYVSRELRGVVRLQNGTQTITLVDTRRIDGGSTDAELDSTFHIELDAALIGRDTRISVSMEEADCDAIPPSAAEAVHARLPESGSKPLAAEAFAPLRVVLVPMSADGRVPVIDAEGVAALRATLLAFYPVAEVELKLRAAIDGIAPPPAALEDRQGWSHELARIRETRIHDHPESDVYYFGLFQPAVSQRPYCGVSGCTLGVARPLLHVASTDKNGIGAYFSGPERYETVVHELGHSHGLLHAPCQGSIAAEGIDPQFPSKDGSIGSWGWDFRTKALVPPSYMDIMSYCEPNWISPYHYRALAERNRQVRAEAERRARR